MAKNARNDGDWKSRMLFLGIDQSDCIASEMGVNFCGLWRTVLSATVSRLMWLNHFFKSHQCSICTFLDFMFPWKESERIQVFPVHIWPSADICTHTHTHLSSHNVPWYPYWPEICVTLFSVVLLIMIWAFSDYASACKSICMLSRCQLTESPLGVWAVGVSVMRAQMRFLNIPPTFLLIL